MPDERPRDGDDWIRHFTSGNEELDRLFLRSMSVGLANDSEVSQAILDRTLQNDARVELHLLGESEDRHLSRADLVGRLLNRLTVTVKEMAKDIGGLRRHSPGLWVEAPSAGSVKLVVRTVQPRRPGDDNPLPATFAPTLDATAVVALCGLMNQATMPGSESPLLGAVQALRGETRAALATMSRVVREADWHIEGNVAIAGRRPEPVVFDHEAASRIIDATSLHDFDTETEKVSGVVDTWSWSRGTMDFIPDVGRMFTAAVPPDLQQTSADANASREHVRATFAVTISYPPGDRRLAVRSRVVTDLAVDPQPQQDDLLS